LRALRQLDLDSYDLIWAERPHIGRLFQSRCARTIVDFDDVTHRMLEGLMRTQPWNRERIHNLYRHHVYRRAELRLFRGYLRILVCSKQDKEYLRARQAGNIHCIPNGTHVAREMPPAVPRLAGTGLRVVFLGNMNFLPNIDAVRYFADEVLPGASGLVRRFDVIGPNAAPELVNEYRDRICFRGFIDDLPAALRGYDAMVAPIRFGSGTKVKVLDALRCGLPLVASSHGVEGLDLVDGIHAQVASTPSAMLAALARIAQHPDQAARMAERGLAICHRRYSWPVIQSALAQLLAGAAGELHRPVRGRQHPPRWDSRPAEVQEQRALAAFSQARAHIERPERGVDGHEQRR
jgi:glycosyltransferase involved in cell wall biosynthesis